MNFAKVTSVTSIKILLVDFNNSDWWLGCIDVDHGCLRQNVFITTVRWLLSLFYQHQFPIMATSE